MADSRPSGLKPSAEVVFVLGAGVDRVFELPLLNTLFRDLSNFITGPGQSINKAIREHVKYMRFDLLTHSAEQTESLGQRLLGPEPHLLPLILNALKKHPSPENTNVRAVEIVMKKLSHMASDNEMDAALVGLLARITGELDSGGGIDTILEPGTITFRPKVRQALKVLFTQVLTEIPNLSQEEQDAFAGVIALLSNFEELMGSFFTGFFTKNQSNQKKYFYLAWLFWAYIRHRESIGRVNRDKSFYKTLSDLNVSGNHIITFNYTDFFCDKTRPKNGYFHGDCRSYLRFDTREYISNNVQLRNATTIEQMARFIASLNTDWGDPPRVSLPAFIPPLAMKPIVCSEYLDRWYECGRTIKAAKAVMILGYSFGVTDEHFNDLLRKGNPGAKLFVVDPNIDAVINRVCQILQHDKRSLRAKALGELECKAGGRLTFIKARAEALRPSHLTELLQF
jgi:hypothetical protein